VTTVILDHIDHWVTLTLGSWVFTSLMRTYFGKSKS
jgi:hypothetical protein